MYKITRLQLITPLISLIIALSSSVVSLAPVLGATAETVPAEIKKAIAQIDSAANGRNLKNLMLLYSPNFKNNDGLTKETLETALQKTWKIYPELKYTTKVVSWSNKGGVIEVETITNIDGSSQINGKSARIESVQKSRQRFQGNKIISQEILSEKTKITSGNKPPTVDFRLPEEVGSGQKYSLDVIVNEPLGDGLLVGGVLQEPIKPNLYLNPSQFDLSPLRAGGIFREGKAGNPNENYWVSTILIKEEGMTVITQRIRVVAK